MHAHLRLSAVTPPPKRPSPSATRTLRRWLLAAACVSALLACGCQNHEPSVWRVSPGSVTLAVGQRVDLRLVRVIDGTSGESTEPFSCALYTGAANVVRLDAHAAEKLPTHIVTGNQPGTVRLEAVGASADRSRVAHVQVTVTPPPTPAQTAAPVSTLGADAVVLAEPQTHRLVEVRLDSASFVAYGSLGPQTRQLNGPRSAVTDAQGRIYAADAGNHRVVRIDDISGAGAVTYGGFGTLAGPRGVHVDAQGRIYIADTGNNRIVRIDDMSGAGFLERKLAPGSVPVAVRTDSAGRVYVADAASSCIHRFDDMQSDRAVDLVAPPRATPSESSARPAMLPLRTPHDLVLDAQNRVYVADTGNDRIVRVDDVSGRGWTPFDGRTAGATPLRAPSGVRLLPDGRIAIADTGNNRLVIIDDMTGAGFRVVGAPGAGGGELTAPEDVVP